MDYRLVKVDSYGSGFFGNFFTILSNIIGHENSGYYPYVNINKSVWANGYDPRYDLSPPENADNPWDWWFDQPIPKTDDNIHYLPFVGNAYFPANTKVWGRNDIPYAKSVSDKYIKIKDHILEKINDFYEKNLKNEIVLGIMARGAEMGICHPEYGNQGINDWINETKKIISLHPKITKIFLVTEESYYVEEFKKEFDNLIYMTDVYRRTTESLEDIVNFSLLYCLVTPREDHKKLLGEECLIQAKLLSMSDYLSVKQCGTSSAAIFFADNNLKNVFYI
jgi:hypothetical protein